MIIEPKSTTIAYRCPACGGVTKGIVGIFSLSGDMFKLKCSCGNSHMTVLKENDQLRLIVPCVSCPQPHQYVLSKNVFFNSDSFILSCSICGIDICFMGKDEKVSEAVEYSNNEIVKMLGDYSLSQLKTNEEKEESVDPMIAEIVRFVVVDLHEEGKIHCGCENNDGDYKIDILENYVSIKCQKCNRCSLIRVDNTISAQDFLDINEITLK